MAGGMVPIREIVNANPTYFRRDLGDLGPLSASLKGHQEAPILLDGTFLVLDGARRLEALKGLGATEVWAISTNSWPLVREQLLAAAARHEAEGAIFLPHVASSIIAMIPPLFHLQRLHQTASAMGPRYGRVKRTKEQISTESVLGTLATINNMSPSAIRRLSIAGNRLREYQQEGENVKAALMEEWIAGVDSGELTVSNLDKLVRDLSLGEEYVTERLQRLAQMFPESEAPLPTKPPPVNARIQARTMNNILATLEGAVAALDPKALSSEHDIADLESWAKRFTPLTTFAIRARARIRTIIQEKEQSS